MIRNQPSDCGQFLVKFNELHNGRLGKEHIMRYNDRPINHEQPEFYRVLIYYSP